MKIWQVLCETFVNPLAAVVYCIDLRFLSRGGGGPDARDLSHFWLRWGGSEAEKILDLDASSTDGPHVSTSF